MSRSAQSNEHAIVLGRNGNIAVVQMPDRAFPAVALQGDTLHNLITQAEEIQVLAQRSRTSAEIVVELADLCDRLRAIGLYYESTLEQNGVSLPYTVE